MVVGQDLGITLDMEQWWMRATAKGIVQSTDLVPMGFDGTTLTLLHHPTGRDQPRTPDWVVLAVPAAPADALYHGLRAPPDSGRSPSSASVTASRPGGPTPPSSRASVPGRTSRCGRPSRVARGSVART